MRRPGNSSAFRHPRGVLVAVAGMTGLTGCAAGVAPPNEVTIIELDEAGVAHRVRSAPELAALLKPKLAEVAEPMSYDESQSTRPF